MTEKKAKPQIRFAGFSDTWEQRKLGELGTITTGSTPSTAIPDYYSDDGIVWVTPTDICENITFESARKLSDLGQQVGRVVPKNTILVTCIASIGKNTMLGNTGSFNQQINGLTPNENECDPYFLLTESALWSAKMKSSAAAGTMQIVNRTEFSELKTWLPSLIEQQAISDFFRQLDHLITLHQRKLDKLTNVKKSMLEKMFPKNGANVPEIRFKGFTAPWEQRKLEDYLTVSVEKNTGNIYGRSDVLSVSGDYGIVNQIEFQGRSFAGASVSNYGVVQTGDVVYTKSPLNSNPYGIIKTNKGKPGIVSTLYAVYHPKENAFSDFIQVYFEQHARMNNYMHPLVNKGAKNDMKVSAENALKGPVCFPSRIEQESISAFFSVLDHLITLHQRKLEKLKNIKKACLEKMFI
ncbi:restriction endonuclease subunit S [Oscillospiraceae bacterium LCP25S3_F9]